MAKFIQDGAPKIAKLPYFSGFMVDITIVFIGVIMVYKPTYNWGAPSCRQNDEKAPNVVADFQTNPPFFYVLWRNTDIPASE